MMTYLRLLLVVLTLGLLTCGNSTGKTSPEDSEPAPTEYGTPLHSAPPPPYPPIPLDRLAYLWDSVTTLDILFYDLPISASQQAQSDLRTSLTFIASDAPTSMEKCIPTGHIWYTARGGRQEDADFYFSSGCVFYLWYETGVPTYANSLTEAGVNFYNNIIQSQRNQ